jgi:alpha-L-arabinofuranosidase
VKDGALQHTAEKEFIRALAGDKSWTDYTLELKARKLGGREGFQIMFHITGDEDRTWWNLGGWRNTQDAIELDGKRNAKKGSVAGGRWYDLKVEVRGSSVKCWLDGALVHDIKYTPTTAPGLYVCAARDDKTDEIIVKVVNANTGPLAAELDLSGAKNLSGQGTTTVLTSENGADENSLADPTKVSPKTEAVKFTGTNLKRSFPGNSFTVLRLHTN